jgi:hypothetical protein
VVEIQPELRGGNNKEYWDGVAIWWLKFVECDWSEELEHLNIPLPQ